MCVQHYLVLRYTSKTVYATPFKLMRVCQTPFRTYNAQYTLYNNLNCMSVQQHLLPTTLNILFSTSSSVCVILNFLFSVPNAQ